MSEPLPWVLRHDLPALRDLADDLVRLPGRPLPSTVPPTAPFRALCDLRRRVSPALNFTTRSDDELLDYQGAALGVRQWWLVYLRYRDERVPPGWGSAHPRLLALQQRPMVPPRQLVKNDGFWHPPLGPDDHQLIEAWESSGLNEHAELAFRLSHAYVQGVWVPLTPDIERAVVAESSRRVNTN